MSSLSKARLRKGFEAARASYRQAARAQRTAARETAARVPALASPIVIEIGAGGGILTAYVMERITPALYVALDLSARLVDPAFMAAPLPFAALAADGEAAPFRPGVFDLLVSSSAMQWYADPAASIRANLALVKPGGFYSLSLFTRGSLAEVAEAARISGFGGVHPLPDASELAESLSGLRPNLESGRITVCYETVEEALRSIKLAGAGHLSGPPRFGKTLYARFREAYQGLFGAPGRLPLTYELLYIWGRVE